MIALKHRSIVYSCVNEPNGINFLIIILYDCVGIETLHSSFHTFANELGFESSVSIWFASSLFLIQSTILKDVRSASNYSHKPLFAGDMLLLKC